MRQIALHPGLVPKDYIDQLKAMLENDDPNKPQITLSPADKSRLQSRLLQAIEDYEECPVCLCTPETNNARITACSHLFCISWLVDIVRSILLMTYIVQQYYGDSQSSRKMPHGMCP